MEKEEEAEKRIKREKTPQTFSTIIYHSKLFFALSHRMRAPCYVYVYMS